MKTKTSFLMVFFSLFLTMGFAQEKSQKQVKEEQKIEKQRQTESLVNSKEFVFIARRAFPLGYRTVDLTTNANFVKFQPDFIKSDMPFFGRAFGGRAAYGGGGFNFEGKPKEFTIEKNKKSYQVKVIVKGESDQYILFLTVGFQGNASLSISSNDRSTISYEGNIFEPEKKEKK
jgi:hypothetical protein